ncbi:MAG: InlB B-repeat-containing protein, partial [Coriobacteriales bacterium]|nr:InlB B-repeat-containing protein [Coriobacteriales bacterium]
AGDAPEAVEAAAVEESVAGLSGQGAEAVEVEVISEASGAGGGGPGGGDSAASVSGADASASAPGGSAGGATLLVELPPDVAVEDALLELAGEEGVAFAQPNYLYSLVDDVPDDDAVPGADGGSGAASGIDAGAGGIPAPDAPSATAVDDPDTLDDQITGWWLYSVRAFDAWDLKRTEGSVAIAVVDTGIRMDHNDLKDNIIADLAWDVVNDRPLSASAGAEGDLNGHGTHVAGIAAARANNGLLTAGVSYNAKVLPVNVFHRNGDGTIGAWTSDEVKAYDYVMSCNEEHGANVRIVNLSLGGRALDYALQAKIAEAKAAGILTVAAAGNDAGKPENLVEDESGEHSVPHYPSDFPEVTAVTAVGWENKWASFSQHNDAKDIAAPGFDVYSTYHDGPNVSSGPDSWASMTGTSQAAPVVSGIAALLFARNPTLTPEEVQQALYGTAVDLGDLGRDDYYGHGLVDAHAALASVEEVIVTHTVTFRDQDGSEIDVQNVAHGTAAVAPQLPPRTGHTFLGWFTEAEGGTEVASVTNALADATYWAHWEADVYTVTFRGHDGSEIDVQNVAHGDAATAPQLPPRIGYGFDGWFTEAEGGTEVTDAAVVTGDVTYYAHWTIRSYTVTFRDWDGRVLAAPRVSHGSAAPAPAAPVRTGHAFTGWDKTFSNVTSDLTVTAQYKVNSYTVTFKGWDGRVLGTPQKVAYGAAASAPKAPVRTGHAFANWDRAFASVTSDLVVTARYKANSYTVRFDASGGKVAGKASSSVKRSYGQKLGKLATPVRTGYAFQGWYTAKARGTKVGAAAKVARNVTYYAHWKAKTYTVRLNANGGKVGKAPTSSLKKAYGSKLVKLSVPKRSGYRFLGWYTKKSGGQKVTASTKVTKAVTLYAHWKRGR